MVLDRERLLDRVLDAKEVDRVVGGRAEGGGVDDSLDAGGAGRGEERSVAGVVDPFRTPAAAPEHAVRGGEHALRAAAGAGERRCVGEVGGDHLGTERRQVGGAIGVATRSAHRDAALAQLPHHGAAQRSAGTDDQDLRRRAVHAHAGCQSAGRPGTVRRTRASAPSRMSAVARSMSPPR